MMAGKDDNVPLHKILIPTHLPRQIGLNRIECWNFEQPWQLTQHSLFSDGRGVEFSSIPQLEFDAQIPVGFLKGPIRVKD